MTNLPTIDEVIATYFAWRGDDVTGVTKTENYKRLKSQLLRIMAAERLDELKMSTIGHHYTEEEVALAVRTGLLNQIDIERISELEEQIGESNDNSL